MRNFSKALKIFLGSFLAALLFFQSALAYQWFEIYKIDAANLAFYDHFYHDGILYGGTLNLAEGAEVWYWNVAGQAAGQPDIQPDAGFGGGNGQGEGGCHGVSNSRTVGTEPDPPEVIARFA